MSRKNSCSAELSMEKFYILGAWCVQIAWTLMVLSGESSLFYMLYASLFAGRGLINLNYRQ